MSSLRPVTGTDQEIFALLRDWEAATDPTPLIIETSGSTGRPKPVMLSRDAMRASARATEQRLGGPGKWVLSLPATYVAGVQVLYRSVLAGTQPIEARGLRLSRVAQMTHGQRSYVSLVATQLVRALQDPAETEALGRFDIVLIGGGPLDPQVRARAERAGVPIVQTYGMSETCGGCVYDGTPLDGVSVRIASDGEVQVCGPVLFDGYYRQPERTAAALVEVEGRRWLRTDDLGTLYDGRLSIWGRRDSMIISGGVKVPALAVERQLSRAMGTEVAVLGVPDPEWGERVVAVSTTECALSALRDAVTPREWGPREFVLMATLPVLENGKLDRVTLQAQVQGGRRAP